MESNQRVHTHNSSLELSHRATKMSGSRKTVSADRRKEICIQNALNVGIQYKDGGAEDSTIGWKENYVEESRKEHKMGQRLALAKA